MAPRKNAKLDNAKIDNGFEDKKRPSPPAMIVAESGSKMKNNVAKDETSTRTTRKATQNNPSKIVVKCDCGFSNTLFIRGEGIANLNWNKGIPLKNVKKDEWVWETDRPFVKAEFKILVNDQKYEKGENHKISNGSTVVCSPNF